VNGTDTKMPTVIIAPITVASLPSQSTGAAIRRAEVRR
jgi:hypothetical protein